MGSYLIDDTESILKRTLDQKNLYLVFQGIEGIDQSIRKYEII